LTPSPARDGKRRRAGLAAALACSAALAAACGSASSPAAAPATTPAPSQSVNPGGPAVSVSPSATPAATGPAPCATSALKVAVPAGNGNAAAGSSYYPVQFSNASATSCTLYGYPGVSFVTAPGGSQIGPAATRNPAFPRQLITLAPGQVAHAELQVVDAENYPPADCGLVTARWLKIYPPNQTAPAYVGFTARACSKPKQILSVQTTQTGATGP